VGFVARRERLNEQHALKRIGSLHSPKCVRCGRTTVAGAGARETFTAGGKPPTSTEVASPDGAKLECFNMRVGTNEGKSKGIDSSGRVD
jgi:hypothetical protein